MDLVLVVEDNPNDIKLAQFMLQESFIVAIASSISEAKSIIISAKPDVILLDLKLPDSIGLTGLKELSEYAPYIPIIIFTGIGNINEAINAGAQGFLLKDEIHKEKIIKIINGAIVKAQFAKAHAKTDEMKKFLADNF